MDLLLSIRQFLIQRKMSLQTIQIYYRLSNELRPTDEGLVKKKKRKNPY